MENVDLSCAAIQQKSTVLFWTMKGSNALRVQWMERSILFPGLVIYATAFGQLLISSQCLQVRLWSTETGNPLYRLDGHSSLVGLLGLSYHYLVSAGADSTLKVWDPASGTCIDTLAANAGAITCFKHDDFRVVSGSEGQLRIWDIRKGKAIRDVMDTMTGVWQVQFSDRFCIAAVQREGQTDFESELLSFIICCIWTLLKAGLDAF